MTKSDIQVGACVRVIIDRWDAPGGTLGRVESIEHTGVTQDWCFTVEWLNRTDQLSRHRHTSLNLFDYDLPDFEVSTGPIAPPPHRNPQSSRLYVRVDVSKSAGLTVSDRTR